MIQKNILNILAAGAMAFTLAGCSDLFDQRPQGKLSDGDPIPGGGYESQVFPMYADIRGYHITTGTTAFDIHCFRSEDAEKGSTASDGSQHAEMFDNFDYVASMGALGDYWSANYTLIYKANDLLEDLKNAGELNSGDLVNKAEALFFRAYCYFNLVRAFGEVPLIDFKVNNPEDGNIAKTSINAIYALIDADLTEAEKHLPQSWDSDYIGRLTWGAARSLHARTYMMRNDWNNMYTAATEVIGSGLYNLDTPYSKIFREEGENGSESIFELQCTATTAKPASGDVGSQFAEVQGVRGAGEWDLGWGWHTPTDLMAGAFESGDPRKDETLLYFVKTGEDPATIPANQPWGEKPVASADVINKYYNKKAYVNPDMRKLYTKHGYWYNVRLIRYSDVVLMAAEAANETSKTADAQNFLEMVRNRARNGNTTILPKVTSSDQGVLRTAIRHERRVELGMEFDRFYDLVRWGTAKTVLHAAGKTGYQDKHALLPLPQNEIDKSNGVLVQNKDY